MTRESIESGREARDNGNGQASEKNFGRSVNSAVHGNTDLPRYRVLDQVRDRYADLRKKLFRWATRSDSRLKTLQAVASKNNVGLLYEKLERVLGVTRRWVKELVGELRDLGVVQTPSNPAWVQIPDKKLYLLIVDILDTLRPSEDLVRPTRVGARYRADSSEGVGNPTPSGDSPPGGISLGSRGNPTPKRR